MPQENRFSNQIVVLVGGRGTRLGSLAQFTPKPLMSITDEKVFLDYLLENIARQGFKDIVILAGHLGEQVEARYGNARLCDAMLSVLIEPTPQGTGGALKFAGDRLAPTFVLVNGDTLFDVNIRAIDAKLHSDPELLGVLALRQHDDAGRFGSVSTGADDRIYAFAEKDPSTISRPGLINGGIYALRREVLNYLPGGPSSIEAELFPQLAQQKVLASVNSSGYFLDIGLPETLEQARAELPLRRRPVLFLDRDGVVNVDKGHVFNSEGFDWIDGAVDLIRRRNNNGNAVIVVTNQAGVAKGKYTESDIWKLHRFIQEQLHDQGAFIDAFYYCPYHVDAVIERYRVANHPDRKPSPGMILRAFKDAPLDRDNAILIGDQPTDIEAASRAGIRGVLFSGGNVSDFENSVFGKDGLAA